VTTLYGREAELRVDDLVLDGLRFTFAIERSLRPTPSKAEIHVFNLNPSHRSQLETAGGVSCSLLVGYRGAKHLIFRGDLRNASSTYEIPTWDTKLDGVDGGTRTRTARVARSYRPGTTLSTVFGDLADALGVGRGNVAEVTAGISFADGPDTFVDGAVMTGAVRRRLDELCRACELEWSIQSGTLQLLPLGRALAGSALVLSADSGLVGTIAREKRDAIKFKTLLIPDLFPGRLVRPDTATIRGGDYRVTRVAYKGDTHGAEWYCEAQAEPL
jgi:hypothetical protein